MWQSPRFQPRSQPPELFNYINFSRSALFVVLVIYPPTECLRKGTQCGEPLCDSRTTTTSLIIVLMAVASHVILVAVINSLNTWKMHTNLNWAAAALERVSLSTVICPGNRRCSWRNVLSTSQQFFVTFLSQRNCLRTYGERMRV